MYDEALRNRATSQREVNDLLQRKSSWSDEDVSRFTQLVRQDHLFEQAEARAKVAAAIAEDAVEREFNELMRSILARYHEEQVWSDKIRSVSTYGSLAVLGLNLAVFVLALVLVEPWKRRRLVQTFEKRVIEMNNENRAIIQNGIADLAEHLARQEVVMASVAQAALILVDNKRVVGTAESVGNEGSAPPETAKSVKNRAVFAVAVSGAIGTVGWFLRTRYS